MKIECDKCGAKYSIADEKVRGKTFKIRCKKCSNVIIVRDKVAAAGAAGGAEPAVDQAHPGWHLAINGETVGPMSEEEVRQRYDAAEIDKDTAIWQEGFEDWMPLGDVDSFADLPERAPADDPFASANQDDYAGAAMAAGGGAAFAAAAAAPMAHAADPHGHSPRVSALTGQRNENSVLFSLDSLQALATGGGGAAAARPAAGAATAPARSKGLATVAPSSEGSGLIDIRALGAMVGQDAPQAVASSAPGVADDAALPSFGGASVGGLASTPLVPQASPVSAAAAAAVAAPPQKSAAPLYAMMAVLIIAVLGLGAFIMMREPEVIVQKPDSPQAPVVVADGGDKDKDEDEDEDKDKDDEDEDEDKDKDDEGEKDDGEPAADTGEKPTTSKGKGKGKGKGRSGKGKGKDAGTFPGLPDPKKDPPPPKKGGDSDLDVDCILDPAKCGKGGGKKGGGSKKPPPPDPSLPKTLASADIRAGVAPHKAAAKACGRKHGAKPGEKVQVKLSIKGSTGTVSSAAAQAPHKGTALGNCVAQALKKSKFKKFQKPSIGAVYPIRM